MPYSGPDDKDLPANVKKLPLKKRKQWISVFESSLSSGDSEAEAFTKANGVVKKNKGYVESWDVDARQLPKMDAEYNAVGMNDEKACASCNWFVTPDSCVLVMGDISPTGLCKLWMDTPIYEMQPVPVTIVESAEYEEGWFTRLVNKVREFLGNANQAASTNNVDDTGSPQPAVQDRFFVLHKDESGRYRFFTSFTNCFKDRHNEIITNAAHKEYVTWATDNNAYPELHLWHAGKESKWGQVDWLDYTDGFVCASGLVDVDKEYIAERLQKEELGVSHGFIALQDRFGTIHRYRTFEISPLPMGRAANDWADINFKKGDVMAFSDAKKKWLKDVSGVDDTTLTQWEQSLENLSTQLKAVGIEYKDNDEPNALQEIAALTKAVSDLASAVMEQKTAITDLQGKVAVVGDIQAQVATFKQSDDERIANVFAAEIAKLPQGFQASADDKNVVSEKQNKEDYSWFGDVLKGVTK